MIKRTLTLAILACAAALPAQAQSKKELVQKLLALQQPGIEAMARGLAEQPAQQAMNSVRQVMQARIAPDQREAVGKKVEIALKKYVEETTPIVREQALKLAPTTGPILEEKFTDDELKQVIAWLESPVNKKFQQIMPEIQNTLVQKLVADSRPLVEPKVKAMELSIRAILDAAAPAPASAASGTGGKKAKPAKTDGK